MSALQTPPAASGAAPASAAFPAWARQTRAPIRAELHGTVALEAQARELSAASPVAPKGRAEGPLLQRLRQNGEMLTRAHRRIGDAWAAGGTLCPDADWLLVTFYVIDVGLSGGRRVM